MFNSFSLGIVIILSTCSDSLATPSLARRLRIKPSKPNGLVTTATVRAPISLAHSATIGAAPVPVPPPIPAAINTISAPSRAALISSRFSSAALAPTSGRAPAPLPSVALRPICNLTGAKDFSNTSASVLITINSTP